MGYIFKQGHYIINLSVDYYMVFYIDPCVARIFSLVIHVWAKLIQAGISISCKIYYAILKQIT